MNERIRNFYGFQRLEGVHLVNMSIIELHTIRITFRNFYFQNQTALIKN